MKKYAPTPNLQQAFQHPSGSFVLKYSLGQALAYVPAFAVAHYWASFSSKYPADGFSYPYQKCLGIWSLIIASIGLILARINLLHFFRDKSVAIALIIIVWGSNYLDYAGINGAMTHNYLFTWYSFLIFLTIRFYANPRHVTAAAIGLVSGIMCLTRPTEIICLIIPLGWGLGYPFISYAQERLQLFKEHHSKLLSAAALFALCGCLQLIYWKYVSGDFLVYSYEDQGFSWLNPHIIDGLFSYRSGWLIYSPLMIFSLIGLPCLWFAQKRIATPIILFSILFIYIAFAWDIWWYGASLGQRAMVQAYAVLAFPLAATSHFVFRKGIVIQIMFFLMLISGVYLNLWFTHQAHKGGLFRAGQMTEAYFWKVIGTYEVDRENDKLLDTDELFEGSPKDKILLLKDSFDADSLQRCSNGHFKNAICLNESNQWSPEFKFEVNNDLKEWIRASADFFFQHKEWNFWQHTQFQLRFYQEDEVVKQRMIRIQRLMNSGEVKNVDFDVKTPALPISHFSVQFWNAYGKKEIFIDNLSISTFNE